MLNFLQRFRKKIHCIVNITGVLYFRTFLTLKFIGHGICLFYIRAVIGFVEYTELLGYLKWKV